MGGDPTENGCFIGGKRAAARMFFVSLWYTCSLVDFQIGNERMRDFRPAEVRFYLHEECPRGGDAILSTQRVFARPGSDFIYTNRTSRKNFFALRAACKIRRVPFFILDGGCYHVIMSSCHRVIVSSCLRVVM